MILDPLLGPRVTGYDRYDHPPSEPEEVVPTVPPLAFQGSVRTGRLDPVGAGLHLPREPRPPEGRTARCEAPAALRRPVAP